jgi:hypothetical protein
MERPPGRSGLGERAGRPNRVAGVSEVRQNAASEACVRERVEPFPMSDASW